MPGFVGGGEVAKIGGHAGVFSRQVRADRLPRLSSVGGLEQHLRGKVERVRIDRREQHRGGAVIAILAGAQRVRRHVFQLAGGLVIARHLSAIDQIGVQRVGCGVGVLVYADGMPIAKGDRAEVAAAGHARAAALLLPAIDPIGKAVVSAYVEHLRRGLVIPGAPGGAAVHGDGGALVYAADHDLRIVGVDPDGVVIVAARRALEGCESLARIGGTVRGSVGGENHIRIFWVHGQAGEIIAAPGHARFRVGARPVLAGVVGAEDAAEVGRVDPGIDALAVAGRNSDADAAESLLRRGQTFGERLPVAAAVTGLKESAAAPGVAVAVFPRALPCRPQRRIHDLRIRWIERHLDASGVLIFVEDFFPALAAIERAIDAALRVGTIRMPEHGHEDAVGVAGIDCDGCDLAAVFKLGAGTGRFQILAQMLPGLAGVSGFVHAIAHGQVRALQALAAAGIDHVGIGGRDRQRADGAGGLPVEDRQPHVAGVGRLPNAAVDRGHVKDVGHVPHAGDGDGASAAKGADHPPLHLAIQVGVELLGLDFLNTERG